MTVGCSAAGFSVKPRRRSGGRLPLVNLMLCQFAQPAAYRIIIGVGLLMAVLWGCSAQTLAVRTMVPLMANGQAAFEKEDDLDLLEKSLPANIKLLEGLLRSDPQNAELLVLLSRGYAGYAFVFFDGRIEEAALSVGPDAGDPAALTDLKTRAVRYYRRGADYALRAIETRHPDARRRLANVKESTALIRELGPKDLPALYWYGFNLSGDINHNRDSISAVAAAHLVEKTMRRVLELDESYQYGTAHLVLLAYYGSRSALAGGRPELALEHYQRLRQMHAGDFLLADLYFARYYLYQRQDRRQFTAVINRILQAHPDREAFRLYNRIAADRARSYIQATDRLFIE